MQASHVFRLVVDKGGLRLDKHVAQEHPELSRSYIQKLIEDSYITVNGQSAKPGLKLKTGDQIIVILPPPPPTSPQPESMPVPIAYEDDDLIVVDKPAGLTVHPAPGHPSHTLVNALLAHCPGLAAIDDSERPGIVHRLDRDTSGLMVVAKNRFAWTNLSRQISSRLAIKQYLLLVRGHVLSSQGIIEAPIGRNPRDRKKMATVAGGRPACTVYKVLRYLDDYTLVEATLKTGRTHQLRVHFSSIGHPVVGDAVYGAKSPFLKRQFVHSYCLGFKLPSTNRYVEFRSELPADLQQALEAIEASSGKWSASTSSSEIT